METTIQNGGWIAVILYLFIKDAIIPVVRKSIPAKVKSDIKSEAEKRNHEFSIEQQRIDMEQKRLEAEIEYKKSLSNNVEKLSEIARVQNERLNRVENGIENIKADTTEIKEALKVRSPRKAGK